MHNFQKKQHYDKSNDNRLYEACYFNHVRNFTRTFKVTGYVIDLMFFIVIFTQNWFPPLCFLKIKRALRKNQSPFLAYHPTEFRKAASAYTDTGTALGMNP